VKGKSEPVVLYELKCLNTHPKFKEITKEFEAAFQLYEEGKFAEAKAAAQKLIDEYDDGPSKVVVDRCEQLLAEPPTDWDGVWKMTSK
jgi:adenylate cyclase